MCALFAMPSRKPSTLNYLLNGFPKHDGLVHSNKSGWGVAYLEGTDAFMAKVALPVSYNPLVKCITIANREGEEIDLVRTWITI